LDPVAGLELVEEVRDVGFGGGDADMELGGDFVVGQAASDEGQDLEFSFGDAVDLPRLDDGVSPAGEFLNEAAGDTGSDEGVTHGCEFSCSLRELCYSGRTRRVEGFPILLASRSMRMNLI
jgi:hypothetical protein